MTTRAMLAKLHRMLRATEREQARHLQMWGECLSTCEALQRRNVLRDVIRELGGRVRITSTRKVGTNP